MTQSFDESYADWCIARGKYSYNQTVNDAFRDGRESRQAEIDEIKAELEILQGMHNATSLLAGDLVDEKDELQKMIDGALKVLSKTSNLHVIKAREILKGESK